jgi:hypothetical protein
MGDWARESEGSGGVIDAFVAGANNSQAKRIHFLLTSYYCSSNRSLERLVFIGPSARGSEAIPFLHVGDRSAR